MPELRSAYNLISCYSWSSEELENIDLLGELINNCKYRVGLYQGQKLVGFAAIGIGASPDKIDNEHLWLGYLALDPVVRSRPRNVHALYESCLTFALAEQNLNAEIRLFTCSETPSVQRALRREGWRHIRTVEILGDDGLGLGETTEVFEYSF